MKKTSKLNLRKFKIAKLSQPGLILGGTGNKTNPNDPDCDMMKMTDPRLCGGTGG